MLLFFIIIHLYLRSSCTWATTTWWRCWWFASSGPRWRRGPSCGLSLGWSLNTWQIAYCWCDLRLVISKYNSSGKIISHLLGLRRWNEMQSILTYPNPQIFSAPRYHCESCLSCSEWSDLTASQTCWTLLQWCGKAKESGPRPTLSPSRPCHWQGRRSAVLQQTWNY